MNPKRVKQKALPLFYKPNTTVPSIPPTCNHSAFLEALDARDYERMHHMYRAVSETAMVLENALTTLQREHKASKPKREDTREDFPAYTLTSGGRLWKHAQPIVKNGRTFANACGWQEFDKQGKHIGTPIGHLAFRKLKIAKKTGDHTRDAWMRISRPEGPWRRHIDCILNHPLYGNGIVSLTDGHHAIFNFHTLEGEPRRVEVIFSTLTEVKVPRPPRITKSVKSVNESAAAAKLTAIALDLLNEV